MDNISDCNKCECHEFVESYSGDCDDDYRDRGHWCMYELKYQTQDGFTGILIDGVYLAYRQYKNKNKNGSICIKQAKTITVRGQKCEVIAVKSHKLWY